MIPITAGRSYSVSFPRILMLNGLNGFEWHCIYVCEVTPSSPKVQIIRSNYSPALSRGTGTSSGDPDGLACFTGLALPVRFFLRFFSTFGFCSLIIAAESHMSHGTGIVGAGTASGVCCRQERRPITVASSKAIAATNNMDPVR